jgi:hypothetical protein
MHIALQQQQRVGVQPARAPLAANTAHCTYHHEVHRGIQHTPGGPLLLAVLDAQRSPASYSRSDLLPSSPATHDTISCSATVAGILVSPRLLSKQVQAHLDKRCQVQACAAP